VVGAWVNRSTKLQCVLELALATMHNTMGCNQRMGFRLHHHREVASSESANWIVEVAAYPPVMSDYCNGECNILTNSKCDGDMWKPLILREYFCQRLLHWKIRPFEGNMPFVSGI
jgi:hypothetical protein